jgi:hypothetical protein
MYRRSRDDRHLPKFLHALTAVHALGALACVVMAVGSAISADVRTSLAVSGGSTIMVTVFGAWTWAFLTFVRSVLATLACASWRVRPWAWPMTLIVYGIGVLGSLWQVSVGIPQGWVAAVVNATVRKRSRCAPRIHEALTRAFDQGLSKLA